MKRAAVWHGESGRWWADVCLAEDWQADAPIAERADPLLAPDEDGHPTHAAALEYALVEVGLATPPEHREAP